ncbi:MAG: ABC transporter permease [Negativicutes bacterium]|nr:ABC transporter permease [Negativicutes bacterium]
MFLKLGVTNAWRNLARSLLAILSMALAASFLSYSVSLGKGYAGGAGQFVRRMDGGEIIAYAERLSLEMPKEGERWTFTDQPLSDFTDYGLYYPEYTKAGYLRLAEQANYFSENDLAAISAVAGVDGVNPIYQMPAWITDAAIASAQEVEKTAVFLQGKSASGAESADHSLEEYIIDGHWFTEAEMDSNCIVVPQSIPGIENPIKVGDWLRLELPAVIRSEDRLLTRWFLRQTIDLQVIGIVAIPTRYVTYLNSATGLPDGAQIYAYSSELYLPQGYWWKLWNQASQSLPYYPEQISIQINSLTYLEDTVYDLSNQMPHFQFISAPKAEERLLRNFSLEPAAAFQVLPASVSTELRNQAMREQQAVISADLRLPILLLILLNAALLVAANILIMVTERKREMAILKAIGSMRKNIVVMVLTEAVMVTILGGSLGFLLVEIQSILNQITNQNPFLSILSSVLQNYGLVIGSTTLIALFFGLFPALKSASMSVMGVLRDE